MPFPAWWVLLGICAAVPGLQAVAGSFPPPCARRVLSVAEGGPRCKGLSGELEQEPPLTPGAAFSSQVYCTGELLRQVQMSRLFPDDKHFVDMPLRGSPEEALQDFQQLVNAMPGRAVSKQQLMDFVESHFSPPGQELDPWEPADWTQSPELLGRISDQRLRSWAQALNAKWKVLGRKIKADVQTRPDRYSLIYVPNPLVVPGGRFREYYYWDSFWVMEGLLLSNMTATVKGMIQNFLHLVEKYGHVPNGGRVYYERRSQPPFLTLMMEAYLNRTQDLAFLNQSLHLLEEEYRFWQEQRAVNISVGGQEHSLNRYSVPVGEPRPESYSKDVEIVQGLPAEAQEALWAELKGAAESGWDFSSRWFLPGPPPAEATLQDTQTSAVVPVDLNAILCRVEALLAAFCQALGDAEGAERFQAAHERRVAAVRAVLWNEAAGVWLDYNLARGRHNQAFYPSNLTPLWAKCDLEGAATEKALRYLESTPALSYAHGLPTSLAHTGQQWDLPNAWAPLQHMVIAGLAKSSSPQAQALAFSLAQNWVRMNLAVYERYQAMFEKYNVEGDGSPGAGGEYVVQEGFGWTNGVALQLLDLFGDRLTAAGSSLPRCSWAWIGAFLALLLAQQQPL
ncbi:trehalase [Heteronotia binoei]|uniref:trehalase n=1 Tax=Heteronotia binoei TaxID=13085 RepID=UPI002930371D|nr:trehalase [Heteronotia binoei]